mmetsp:Transcript_21036/g.58485  ORF Transcript_21036/g.58485 Transcript_21036/m.58485 type:complete len:309 (+) Transcript_21036:1167-2093(+)
MVKGLTTARIDAVCSAAARSQAFSGTGTNLDNSRYHLDQGSRKEVEKLVGEYTLRLDEYVVDVVIGAIQRVRKEVEIVDRTGHPGELRQKSAQVPSYHHCADSATNETLPGLVGRKPNKRPLNEPASHRYPAKVGHDVVADHQKEWKGKPKEAIENVVHDVFHLSDRQAQHHDRPAQLVELKLDVSDLHGGDGQHKDPRVQAKGDRVDVLGVGHQVVQVRIGLDDLRGKVSVGVKDGNRKPRPLGRPKKGNRVLDLLEVRVVANLDQLAKEEEFCHGHDPAHVQVPQKDAGSKDGNEADSRHHADQKF